MIVATKNASGTVIDITIPTGTAFLGLAGPSRVFVPVDPDNSDYAEFLSLGIEPGEWVAPPPPIPASVTQPS